MARLVGALTLVSRALLAAAAAAVLAMTALVVLSVIMRYVIGSPLAFTEELVALLYLAMAFFTIPISTIRREHIVVSIAVDRSGLILRRALAMLASAVMIVFAVWFAWETSAFAAFSSRLGARSEQVGLLLWPWMAIMPATMALVAGIALAQQWRSIRDPGMRSESAPHGPPRDGL